MPFWKSSYRLRQLELRVLRLEDANSEKLKLTPSPRPRNFKFRCGAIGKMGICRRGVAFEGKKCDRHRLTSKPDYAMDAKLPDGNLHQE
jgi:hypothetical protein